MSIIVQRNFRVAHPDQPEFERLSSEGVWKQRLHMGSQMVAYGRWTFGGGRSDEVTANGAYADFEHWIATRDTFAGAPGALYEDEAIAAETSEAREIAAGRPALVSSYETRIIEVNDDVSAPRVYYRRPGMPPAEPPPTFGRGSVVSERTYQLAEADQAGVPATVASLHLAVACRAGARMIAYGHDPLGASDEVITLFAFRSLPEWQRLSRPSVEQASAEVAQAWRQRAALIRQHRGRLLIIDTDFGTPI